MPEMELFLSVYLVVVGVALLLSLIPYLLQSFGLYNMAKACGFANPWTAFIPYANTFTFGRIAEKYQKKNGTKSAKFGAILLTLQIVMVVVLIAFVVFMIALIGIAVAKGDEISEETVLTIIIPFLLMYLAILGVAIAYTVVYYVALWRIFAIFDNYNATTYTVLSIFFSILAPIFLFVVRKNPPVFDPMAQFKEQYAAYVAAQASAQEPTAVENNEE